MKKYVPRSIGCMVEIYFSRRVSRSAAAFAFFFILSLFPMLIVISVMLGSLNIQADSLARLLEGVVPEESLKTILYYLSRIPDSDNGTVIVAGLATMIGTSAAAFRVIQTTMADILGAARFHGIFSALFSFVFSMLFLAVIYLSILVVVSGTWLVNWLTGLLKISGVGGVWNWFRFVLMFLLLSGVLYGIYRLTAPPEKPARQRWIGALAASAAIVAMSILFSWFIGMSTKYSLLYGSLASLIILMTWMYMCGNVLIMGNVLNLVVNEYRARKLSQAQEAEQEKK